MRIYKNVGIFNGVVIHDRLTDEAWYQTRDGSGDPNAWVTVESDHAFHPKNEFFTGELILDSKPEPEPIFEPLPTPEVGDYIKVTTRDGKIITGTVMEVGDSNPHFDRVRLGTSESGNRTVFINRQADTSPSNHDMVAWEHAEKPFEPMAPGTYLAPQPKYDGYARLLFRDGIVEWIYRGGTPTLYHDSIVLEHVESRPYDYLTVERDLYPQALVDLMFEGAAK